MSAPTALPALAQTSHRPVVAFWPLFAWLGLQLLALLAAAWRVPFSARFPAPEEQLAMHEMLLVQMAASALLFPLLFRSVATAALVIAVAPLMVQLSAVMAAMVEFEKLVAVMAYVTLWLAGLALWSSALRSPRARMYGVAAANLLVLGGAVAAYLQREFGAMTFDWGRDGYLGPIVGAMAILEAGARTGTAWAFLGIFLLSGTLAAATAWRRSKIASQLV